MEFNEKLIIVTEREFSAALSWREIVQTIMSQVNEWIKIVEWL